ncbi:MD1L1-like protein [Mya arenaria]|uniref:MD1L1-like protein n=1 Tax=Mya arenaria TaxID=6604 RepID=A0ABY7DIN0_MYAAR|nr:MD1L1-like protein [Mya arenaria]
MKKKTEIRGSDKTSYVWVLVEKDNVDSRQRGGKTPSEYTAQLSWTHTSFHSLVSLATLPDRRPLRMDLLVLAWLSSDLRFFTFPKVTFGLSSNSYLAAVAAWNRTAMKVAERYNVPTLPGIMEFAHYGLLDMMSLPYGGYCWQHPEDFERSFSDEDGGSELKKVTLLVIQALDQGSGTVNFLWPPLTPYLLALSSQPKLTLVKVIMAFLDDNTSLVRMKRDFDSFVCDHNDSRGVKHFRLDDAENDSLRDRSGELEALSVQTLLAKEKQYKYKEAEYIHAKSEIIRLKATISNLETANQKARILFEQQLEKAMAEKMRENSRVGELMTQLKYLEQRESLGREKLSDAQSALDKQRKSFEEQILTLQKERLQLSDNLEQEKESNWEKMTELRSEMRRKDSELSIVMLELDETKVQLKLQLKRWSDVTSQMQEGEEVKLKAAQAEQKVKIVRMEEDKVISTAMKSQLASFQEMEKQNRKLSDDNTYLRGIQENNLLLKEQHDNMQNKVERLENKLANYHALVAENEVACQPEQESDGATKWRSSDAVKARGTSDSKEMTLRNLQEHQSQMQQQERDGYKRIIDSYESEVTVSLDPSSQASINRVALLEDSVQGYKRQTENLEAELNKVGGDLASARQNIRQLELTLSDLHRKANYDVHDCRSEADQKTINSLREKVASLERALETCEQEKNTLECRIEQRHLQGDYDPTKLKVLHFKMNPVDSDIDRRREEMTKLREENARLRQRIQLLEEHDGKIEDLTVAVEQKIKEPGSSKDIEEMRSQLTLAELKNKRLMEAFKKTSQEVREVCYQLTGYKIDIPTSNQYRITSMYAESPTDYLLFQQNSRGNIEMLGTSFSSTLQDLMDMYLIQRDSIPAFLSSVTLDLFSRQTMNFG